MTWNFYKTRCLNQIGERYVKLPLSNQSILNIGNSDTSCASRPVLAHPHHSTTSQSFTTSYQDYYFNEINVENLYMEIGFRDEDIPEVKS